VFHDLNTVAILITHHQRQFICTRPKCILKITELMKKQYVNNLDGFVARSWYNFLAVKLNTKHRSLVTSTTRFIQLINTLSSFTLHHTHTIQRLVTPLNNRHYINNFIYLSIYLSNTDQRSHTYNQITSLSLFQQSILRLPMPDYVSKMGCGEIYQLNILSVKKIQLTNSQRTESTFLYKSFNAYDWYFSSSLQTKSPVRPIH